MAALQLIVREQITKSVVRSGNGGAVWVPKSWLGQQVVVTLPEQPYRTVRERIIHLLQPYLKDIAGIYLYGSHARGEAQANSDIDVLVITNSGARVALHEPGIEVSMFTWEGLKHAIQEQPVLYAQVVREAEPLLNAALLKELRSIPIPEKSFHSYLRDTKLQLRSSRALLMLDVETGTPASASILYSTMLRLRGLFIISCLRRHKLFSTAAFRKWAEGKGISAPLFRQAQAAYRTVRDRGPASAVVIPVAEKLLDVLERELGGALRGQ